MANLPRILAFSGSTRGESLNKKLLMNVVEFARNAGAEVTSVDLREYALPLYDGDLEQTSGLPERAQALVALMSEHHALLIASPEYNSMMTPLLKNTLDWCTRAEQDPFESKVAAVVSASPGMLGGIRSMTLVRQLLTHLGCHVIPQQCVLPQADKAFDGADRLTVARTQEAARKVAISLVETTRRLRGL